MMGKHSRPLPQSVVGPQPSPRPSHTPHSLPGGPAASPLHFPDRETEAPAGQMCAQGCTTGHWWSDYSRWPDTEAKEKTGRKERKVSWPEAACPPARALSEQGLALLTPACLPPTFPELFTGLGDELTSRFDLCATHCPSPQAHMPPFPLLFLAVTLCPPLSWTLGTTEAMLDLGLCWQSP